MNDLDPSELARWQVDELVDIGPLLLRIVSDVPDFAVLSYFSRSARRGPSTGVSQPDAEVWCVSTSPPPATWTPDSSTRAEGFRKGYYITDHAGPPVIMVSAGRTVVLFGARLDRLVWSYLIKVLLLRYTVEHGGLFLKAAAISVDDHGVLIIGRGGGGKTVMTSELCRRGAQFITNSHALIDAGSVTGVATSMRMRPGPWVSELKSDTRPALDSGEVVVDPHEIFVPALALRPVRHVAVVNYRGPGHHDVRALPTTMAHAIAQQFSDALNVYRLEEDLLDDLGGDYERFAEVQLGRDAALRALVENSRCHFITTDVRQAEHAETLLELWSGP